MRPRCSQTLSVTGGVATLLLMLLVPFDSAAEEEPSAEEIVDSAMEVQSFSTEAGEATLSFEISTDDGDVSSRTMSVRSKEIGGRARTLVELTDPADLKGQSFLFAENPDSEDDVWMYVPAFSVTRRIEGSKKNSAFLGSHFTYSDFESRDVEQAAYEKTGRGEIGGDAVYEVKATPNDDANSEYSKVVLSVRKKDLVPLKFEFYKDGEIDKTLYVRALGESSSGETYIERMRMSAEDGGHTELTVESLNPDASFPDTQFSKDQLGK